MIRKAVTSELESYRLLKGLGNSDQQEDSFCKKVEVGVSRLPEIERSLITKRYLEQESERVTDVKIYNYIMDPPISNGKYDKIRTNAMIKLALFLNIDTGVELILE